MLDKNFLFILLIIWGIPSTYFRSKFRKIVYKTDDWKINIKPLFKKEIVGLISNIYPGNKEYLKTSYDELHGISTSKEFYVQQNELNMLQ